LQRLAEIDNSRFQQGCLAIYRFAAACGNIQFSVSAAIYSDLLLCSDLWETNSQFQQGFIAIDRFAAVGSKQQVRKISRILL
jgi:hypothetical protein